MTSFWLSRSKTDGGLTALRVSLTRSEPRRVVKTEKVKQYDPIDGYVDTGRTRKADYFTGRPSLILCPSGVLRATGLRIKPGQAVKVKLVRV